jgi:hypothetical protein
MPYDWKWSLIFSKFVILSGFTFILSSHCLIAILAFHGCIVRVRTVIAIIMCFLRNYQSRLPSYFLIFVMVILRCITSQFLLLLDYNLLSVLNLQSPTSFFLEFMPLTNLIYTLTLIPIVKRTLSLAFYL